MKISTWAELCISSCIWVALTSLHWTEICSLNLPASSTSSVPSTNIVHLHPCNLLNVWRPWPCFFLRIRIFSLLSNSDSFNFFSFNMAFWAHRLYWFWFGYILLKVFLLYPRDEWKPAVVDWGNCPGKVRRELLEKLWSDDRLESDQIVEVLLDPLQLNQCDILTSYYKRLKDTNKS